MRVNAMGKKSLYKTAEFDVFRMRSDRADMIMTAPTIEEQALQIIRERSLESGHQQCPPMPVLITREMAAMDFNLLKFPGLVTFQKSAVPRKSLSLEFQLDRGKYIPISEELRIELNLKKDKSFNTATLNLRSGQLGESEFDCYRYLERCVYSLVTSKSESFIDDNNYINGYVNIEIGSLRQFALNAIGYDSKFAYETCNAFFYKLNGISVSYSSSTISNEKSKHGYSVKTSQHSKLKYFDGTYKPFDNLHMSGSRNKQIVNVGLHKNYVINLIYRNGKRYYIEISDKINNSMSDYLLRLLISRDAPRHKGIHFSYDELVNHLGIKRKVFKKEAVNQIAEIARRINFDPNFPILVYTNKDTRGEFSQQIPFWFYGDKKPWNFTFQLNTDVTPGRHTYHENEEFEEFVADNNLDSLAISTLKQRAKDIGLTLNELVSKGIAYHILFNNKEVKDIINAAAAAQAQKNTRKKNVDRQSEGYKDIKIGRDFKKVMGGEQPAKDKITELNVARLKEEEEMERYMKEQELARNERQQVKKAKGCELPF